MDQPVPRYMDTQRNNSEWFRSSRFCFTHPPSCRFADTISQSWKLRGWWRPFLAQSQVDHACHTLRFNCRRLWVADKPALAMIVKDAVSLGNKSREDRLWIDVK